jgi:putative hydrolase of the HAD superfamily
VAIEAVLFDFGGVLTSSPFDAFARFEAARGLPKDHIRRINSANPLENAWARFERGEIDHDAFDREYREESAALGHAVSGAEVMAALSGEVRPRMVAALKRCKEQFKVGCITNNMNVSREGRSADAHERTAAIGEIMTLFDAVIESSKSGLRKPDPKIYLMMCELLGVEPAACVYLDDLGVNCKPAFLLGMTAIKVVTEDQALDDLARATGLSFP